MDGPRGPEGAKVDGHVWNFPLSKLSWKFRVKSDLKTEFNLRNIDLVMSMLIMLIELPLTTVGKFRWLIL